MSDLYFFINTFTVVYASLILFLSLRSIIFFGLKPCCLLIVVFYFVFVFPYISDIFIKVDFKNFPGFYQSFYDEITNIIYCFFVLYTLSVFWFFRGREVVKIRFKSNVRYLDILLFLLLIFPFLFFSIIPNKSNYLIYGGDWLRGFSEIDYIYFSYLNISIFISAVVASYFFVKYIKVNVFISIFSLIILILDFYLNGKRGIVIFSILILCFFSFFYWKRLKSLVFITLLLVGLIGFNSWYQSTVRSFNNDVSVVEKYENLRIDYFRDQRVKMAIYAEIYPEKIKILEYSGQSFLFYLTFFIPREIWEGKPLPYAQYFTSALYLTSPQMWGWGMSTSIFDEFIANFGFVGMLLLPLIIVLILNKSIRLNKYFGLYTLFLIVLLFMLQMISFMFLYIFWFIVYIYICFFRKGLYDEN